MNPLICSNLPHSYGSQIWRSFRMLFFFIFIFVVFSGGANAQIGGSLVGSADYALVNGKVYTVNEEQPWAEAIAIDGSKIMYVGDASGLKSVIGYGTEIIDLDGKMVLPGFVDGHVHPMAGSLLARGIDLQTDDRNELFDRLKTYVAERPDDDIILGYGWRFTLFIDGNPTKDMLDEIEADRPVFLWAIDGHAAWVNTKALEVAGVDKDTPDTVPGFSFFERDADGNPTGYIIEVPAMMEVFSVLKDVDLDYITAGLAEWLPKFSAAGLTAAHDYGIMGIGMDEGFQLYLDLEKAGDLPLRIAGTYYWNNPDIDPIPMIEGFKDKYTSRLVRPERIKVNLDGGDDKWNALFVDPYSDKPEVEVKPIIPDDVLNEVVKRADAKGIDVVCHCFGDLAVRKLLDAVEGAIAANPPRDRRNSSGHMVLVHPDDVPRFAETGVVAQVEAGWGALDPHVDTISRKRLGDERIDRYLGINELWDAGATVAFSSDWPAAGYLSNIEPLVTIQVAVTRQILENPTTPPLGGKAGKVSLERALKAHTLNAAYGMGMDAEIGSLEVGKLADLVVLEKNLFDVPPNEISKVKVLYTVMDGKLVYEAERQ